MPVHRHWRRGGQFNGRRSCRGGELVVQLNGHKPGDLSGGFGPVVGADAAVEVAAGVLDVGVHRVLPTDAIHREGEVEVRHSLAKSQRAFEPGVKLASMRSFQQHISGFERKH